MMPLAGWRDGSVVLTDEEMDRMDQQRNGAPEAETGKGQLTEAFNVVGARGPDGKAMTKDEVEASLLDWVRAARLPWLPPAPPREPDNEDTPCPH